MAIDMKPDPARYEVRETSGFINHTFTVKAPKYLAAVVLVTLVFDSGNPAWSQIHPGPCVVDEYEGTDLSQGSIGTRYVHNYDSAGNVVQIDIDFMANGVIDDSFLYTFDDFGNRTMERVDALADGVIDKTTMFLYDEDGVLEETYQVDASGEILEHLYLTYNRSGNIETVDRIAASDGLVLIRVVSYLDEDGRVLFKEVDGSGLTDPADGEVDTRTTFTRDLVTNTSITERDNDADGVIDQRTIETWDAQDNIIMVEIDGTFDVIADGLVDRLELRTLDSFGNILVVELDHDADGNPDATHAYDYTCWSE